MYRYNASSEGAPRGTFYTANSSSQGTLPGRHIQFNTATNPWDREEKERVGFCLSVLDGVWFDVLLWEMLYICKHMNLTRSNFGCGNKFLVSK